MTKLLAATFLLAFLPTVVSAQAPNQVHFQPYMFLAPGGISSDGYTQSSLHVGGGVEVLTRNGVGGGIELGYAGGFPDGFDYGIGLLSLNGSYHLTRGGTARLVPFVTGGFTPVVIRGEGLLLNAGGGVKYWLGDGFGLRLEFRDHIRTGDHPAGSHIWGVRMGFAWGRH